MKLNAEETQALRALLQNVELVPQDSSGFDAARDSEEDPEDTGSSAPAPAVSRASSGSQAAEKDEPTVAPVTARDLKRNVSDASVDSHGFPRMLRSPAMPSRAAFARSSFQSAMSMGLARPTKAAAKKKAKAKHQSEADAAEPEKTETPQEAGTDSAQVAAPKANPRKLSALAKSVMKSPLGKAKMAKEALESEASEKQETEAKAVEYHAMFYKNSSSIGLRSLK